MCVGACVFAYVSGGGGGGGGGVEIISETGSKRCNVCDQNTVNKIANMMDAIDHWWQWFNKMIKILFYASYVYIFIPWHSNSSYFPQVVRT